MLTAVLACWTQCNRSKFCHLSACLKLLSKEEIRQLDFPGFVMPTSPKRILYKSVLDESHMSMYSSSSQQLVQGSRINLFTGNQTFEEREDSFKVFYE